MGVGKSGLRARDTENSMITLRAYMFLNYQSTTGDI